MRTVLIGICALSAILQSNSAKADYVFDTVSSATQTITSPLLGGSVNISALGSQHFDIDTADGTATVSSFFQGTDLGGLSYNLFNTTHNGTVTLNSDGSYNITFNLLFELDITSPPYNGLQLATTTPAIFENIHITTFPFVAGTTFGDPNPSGDSVIVYVQHDPSGTYPQGTPFGTSSNRVVTINSVVPEPSSLVLCVFGAVIAGSLSRTLGRKKVGTTDLCRKIA